MSEKGTPYEGAGLYAGLTITASIVWVPISTILFQSPWQEALVQAILLWPFFCSFFAVAFFFVRWAE